MKIPREIKEVPEEGLLALIGQEITLFCAIYIYAGKLVGVNDKCVKIENPKIVYETGPFDTKAWKDAQKLPSKYHYVTTNLIESFGVIK